MGYWVRAFFGTVFVLLVTLFVWDVARIHLLHNLKAEQVALPADTLEKDKLDLIAQQQMADWAFWMVVLTAGGLALSVVGAGLIFATFNATREQLAEARKKTKLDRLRSQALVKVRITGGVVHYFHDKARKPTFHLAIENAGETDASNVSIALEGWHPDARQEDVGFGNFHTLHNAGYLYQHSLDPEGIAVLDGYVLPDKAIAAVRNAKPESPVRSKVSVNITWNDAFGDPQASGPFFVTGQLLSGGNPDHVRFVPSPN